MSPLIEEAAIRYCDAEAATLTAQELARLEQLPDAAHEVPPEVECELGLGHAGPHVGLGQSQDHEWDDQTNWWLRWTDTGGREWTHEATCAEERGDEGCLLPAGHAGEHHWV